MGTPLFGSRERKCVSGGGDGDGDGGGERRGRRKEEKQARAYDLSVMACYTFILRITFHGKALGWASYANQVFIAMDGRYVSSRWSMLRKTSFDVGRREGLEDCFFSNNGWFEVSMHQGFWPGLMKEKKTGSNLCSYYKPDLPWKWRFVSSAK
ncbi:hypothetical protein Droror1_Dr00009035 [Drosera rotundifolia]